MKKLLFILCLALLSASASFAQTKPSATEQQLLDSLCSDLGKIDMTKLTTKPEATDAFMSCFLKHTDLLVIIAGEQGVEMTDQPALHKLGMSIGVNLMKQQCAPFIKLSSLMAAQSKTATAQSTTGTFKRIDNKGFNYIVVTEGGSEKSFIWLKQFAGSEAFMGVTTKLAGKKLKITWQEIEVYLPQAKGYYKVKEITGIQIL
ncbi:hypothetical protein GCM10023149_35640 [Mucilaginibacter gynuensis]|uniref:DUF4252 domain-containing protein n=1 Tax=Mucilaginibacter gynuensis TaxID=1302236 RepID=A0ABP8GV70_9SPHI